MSRIISASESRILPEALADNTTKAKLLKVAGIALSLGGLISPVDQHFEDLATPYEERASQIESMLARRGLLDMPQSASVASGD